MEYTRFTNLEVTGHLKVAGEEVTPGGGGGGVLVVHVDNSMKLDKTWQQIHDAALAVFQHQEGTGVYNFMVQGTAANEGEYSVALTNGIVFLASSASGYPEYFDDGGGGEPDPT